jgi:2-amino-4-hydroxy-6-hydroxymethyldihydropteridine diphosphokinase
MSLPGPVTLLLLGSNVEPERHVQRCFERLAEMLTILRCSSVYITAPVVLRTPAADFLNVALSIATQLSPVELKRRILRPLEQELGRVRVPGDKTAPRSIDVDILAYGDLVQREPLVLPDPALASEPYALIPAAEIEPDFKHPELGLTLRVLAAQRGSSGVRKHPSLRLV